MALGIKNMLKYCLISKLQPIRCLTDFLAENKGKTKNTYTSFLGV